MNLHELSPEEVAQLVRDEQRRFTVLRLQLLENHPFWGFLLLPMKLVPETGLPAIAATDCIRTIWFNPLWTVHLDLSELGFVLVHELGHVVFATNKRARGRHPFLWNCATDYAINRIVSNIRKNEYQPLPMYTAPDKKIPGLGEVKILRDAKFDGMIAETIYERLLEEDSFDFVTVEVVLSSSGPGGDNRSRTFPTVPCHGGLDIHLPDTLTNEEREDILERIQAAIRHWRKSAGRGDVPCGEFIDLAAGQKSRVPWTRVLRSFVGQARAQDDYSRAKPNKRFLEHDFIVPGLYSEKIGMVVVCIDTSGSMKPDDLATALNEIRALMSEAEEILVITADAEVQQFVSSNDLPAFLHRRRVKGGGGTDHQPVFEWLAEHRIFPEVFIGLSDCASSFPARRPPFPVVWLVPEEHEEPPWGRVVPMRG